MLAQLIPFNGGPPITIDRDITLVGRHKELCDVVIDRRSISKMHCILVRTDGLLFVRDLSSTNGTRVNGQRVIRGALLPGDQLSVANEKFRVHLGPDQPADVGAHEQTEMISANQLAPAIPVALRSPPPTSKSSRRPPAVFEPVIDDPSSSDVRPLADDDDLVE